MKRNWLFLIISFFVLQCSAVFAKTIVTKSEKAFTVTDGKGVVHTINPGDAIPKIDDDSVVSSGEGDLMLLLENGSVVKMGSGAIIRIPMGKDIEIIEGKEKVTVTKPNVVEPYQPPVFPEYNFDTRIHDEEHSKDISPTGRGI